MLVLLWIERLNHGCDVTHHLQFLDRLEMAFCPRAQNLGWRGVVGTSPCHTPGPILLLQLLLVQYANCETNSVTSSLPIATQGVATPPQPPSWWGQAGAAVHCMPPSHGQWQQGRNLLELALPEA